MRIYVEISFVRRKKTVFPFPDFLLWKVPSVRSLGDLHKHPQQTVAANLKKMKLTDFTPQFAVSPTAVGVGGREPRGGALQPLTSPSPSGPEV